MNGQTTKQITSLICINCPMGCRLTVDHTDMADIIVAGNACPRGAEYARTEVTAPKRTVTGSVRVRGGDIAMVSIKTSAPIPKQLIFDSLKALAGVSVDAPVEIGDIVLKDVCGSGVDFVATKKIERVCEELS